MALDLIITDAGRAALVNAAATGTSPVTIASIGVSATAVTPTAAATTLPGEIKRITAIGGTATAADTIHVSLRDDSSDAYSLRSFALYLSSGVLFAIYGQASTILSKSAAATALIAMDVVFADVSSASLTFGATNFTDPDATTSTRGLVELATNGETASGTDGARAVTPAALAYALMGLLLARDGSGSGLDADLLDGQHGSYYANVIARLGYTPVDKAGDTMTGPLALSGDPSSASHATRKAYVDALVTGAAVLAQLLTVDGSGSGLDADLLDGQHGSYYANVIARLGYTPLDKAGDTMTGQLALAGDPASASHAARKAYVDAQTVAAVILSRLLTVDGSGSGLDADTVDGKHASDFASADTFGTGTNVRGRWWKMPDGAGGTVIEQQGRIAGRSTQGTLTITFPIPFTDTDYDLQLTTVIPGASDYDNYVQEVDGTRTTSQVTVFAQDPAGGASTVIAGVRWRAKGY
ncbi:hypothetical protein [Novosphingobium sp.]|uniref:gp53-like domain-containing protein n=1 Tax=Novosphingobium sp. TaxID=1874826 RepID=UPI0038BD0B9D